MAQQARSDEEPAALETHNQRLQTLVSELLLKNQQLREELARLLDEREFRPLDSA